MFFFSFVNETICVEDGCIRRLVTPYMVRQKETRRGKVVWQLWDLEASEWFTSEYLTKFEGFDMLASRAVEFSVMTGYSSVDAQRFAQALFTALQRDYGTKAVGTEIIHLGNDIAHQVVEEPQ